MSVLDEVMPADEPHQQTTTVLVDGVPTFVPRAIVKPVLGNLVVGVTTTPDITVSHYVVGDGVIAYHMFHDQANMNLVDVIATAYRNVFMWIRPQGQNGTYYAPHTNRKATLEHMASVLHELVGTSASAKMYEMYEDDRLLEVGKGEEAFLYHITRKYDRKNDRITTTIMTMPERFAELSADEIYDEGFGGTLQVTPAWIDPGDFIPGVWTPDPNADMDEKPRDEFNPDNQPA